MTELLTAAQMRAIEAAVIDSGEVTGLELMERAGAGVVRAVQAEWPRFATNRHTAVVLCGPGNNGGDGFVVARLLAKAGWAVDVFLYGDAEKLPPDARTNFQRWSKMGPVEALTAETLKKEPFPGRCDLVVDALFGTGLARAVSLPLDALDHDRGSDPAQKIVAVDIPSGLCSDSGRRIGAASQLVSADLTVAFHRAKLGHMLAQGPVACGKCVVADIGL